MPLAESIFTLLSITITAEEPAARVNTIESVLANGIAAPEASKTQWSVPVSVRKLAVELPTLTFPLKNMRDTCAPSMVSRVVANEETVWVSLELATTTARPLN